MIQPRKKSTICATPQTMNFNMFLQSVAQYLSNKYSNRGKVFIEYEEYYVRFIDVLINSLWKHQFLKGSKPGLSLLLFYLCMLTPLQGSRQLSLRLMAWHHLVYMWGIAGLVTGSHAVISVARTSQVSSPLLSLQDGKIRKYDDFAWLDDCQEEIRVFLYSNHFNDHNCFQSTSSSIICFQSMLSSRGIIDKIFDGVQRYESHFREWSQLVHIIMKKFNPVLLPKILYCTASMSNFDISMQVIIAWRLQGNYIPETQSESQFGPAVSLVLIFCAPVALEAPSNGTLDAGIQVNHYDSFMILIIQKKHVCFTLTSLKW